MNLPNLESARIRTSDATIVKRNDYIVPEDMKQIGKGKYYCLYTYGCQMNVHDSENIAAIMEDMGYKRQEDMENSDVVILNTCAIRENAHNKVMGMLGRVKHLKETKSDLITIFCGCMAQEEGISLELKNKFPWVDIIIGTHNIHKLPLYLKETLKTKEQMMEVFSIEGDIIEGLPVKRDSKYKAWVNIMYGCDKFCTYCIVPYTRGKQRSRLPEDILKEVKDLVANGYQEVTLLGQNVNAYGKDLKIHYNMANLLEDVAKTNIPRVRFVTSHPWDFSDEMIKIIAKYDNIMPYIHLPLQSGSTKILKKMGRRYTKEEYKELFYKIKKIIPNCAITTDIIVGFPGETKDDFQDTIDLVNELKYDLAYTFIYSPREGTPASIMKDETSLEEKKKRLATLNELINKYALWNNQKYLGKTVDVLIEGPSDKDNKMMGYTDTMKLVNIDTNEKYIGKIVPVKITDVKTWSMDGEIIDD
ncbi:MAG: tRNA (N6-isopentenyl adenosine(37)-C2)-methylthiotransferase MiaB [Erysipelotrichaceae bacterium]|nr:tRNA (N6-isopentenyl adenosine(37)-C2)-methylthiotransferase MiaB [Erysipelotrichaceae bacterium]